MTGPIDYAWATLQKAWYDQETSLADEVAGRGTGDEDAPWNQPRSGPTPLSPEEIMRFTRPELIDMGRSIEMELSRREVMREQRRGGPQPNVATGPGQTMGASAGPMELAALGVPQLNPPPGPPYQRE